MAKKYMIRFGSGDSRSYAVATPTFNFFYNAVTGVSLSAPGITAIFPATGQYWFEYGPTQTIGFQIDGGASLVGDARYITGSLDPVQAIDEQLGVIYVSGATNISSQISGLSGQIAGISAAIGNISTGSSSLAALIGGVTSPYGTTAIGASTLFGQVNRVYEVLAGDKTYNKQTGVWTMFDRGGTLALEIKTLSNDYNGATSV